MILAQEMMKYTVWINRNRPQGYGIILERDNFFLYLFCCRSWCVYWERNKCDGKRLNNFKSVGNFIKIMSLKISKNVHFLVEFSFYINCYLFVLVKHKSLFLPSVPSFQ